MSKSPLDELAESERRLALALWTLTFLPGILGALRKYQSTEFDFSRIALTCVRAALSNAVAGFFENENLLPDAILQIDLPDILHASIILTKDLPSADEIPDTIMTTTNETELIRILLATISGNRALEYVVNGSVRGDFAYYFPNEDTLLKQYQKNVPTLKILAEGFSLHPQFDELNFEFGRYCAKVSAWSFWGEWYNSFRTGNPLDWELQKAIALIPDAEWDKGAEHIGNRIAEIRARFDLKKRLAELDLERDQAIKIEPRLAIGGNRPPEPIEDTNEILRQMTVVWISVDQLKQETEKVNPNKAYVERVVGALSRAVVAILGWCAAKGDLAVDTLIKWGIPAGAMAVLANPELLNSVVEAAKIWLTWL